MPTADPQSYFPVLLQILLAGATAAALVTLSWLIGHRTRSRQKDTPYECGMAPTGSARERFSVKFYLVAIVFILFDIEAVFLYPWVVVYRDLRLFAFFEMLLFIALIVSGFFYIWKKGALDWAVGSSDKASKQ